MKKPIQLLIQVPLPRSSTSRSLRRLDLFLILLAGLELALSPLARAVTPPPDGGYANGNTAEGEDALFSVTDVGFYNTALGFHALYSTTGGYYNTATGNNALFSLINGDANTATGFNALYSTTSGTDNTAMGFNALVNNRTGRSNTAIGDAALSSNVKGHENTATGVQTLYYNTTGHGNVANGLNALYSNTTGSDNIAVGAFAGYALTTGSNNIDIGNNGVPGESGAVRIGTTQNQRATFIAGISGVTVAGGVNVIVDANGHLGTVTSSARYKDAIQPMDKASESILALRPVTFRYKHELDPDGIPQFGLVAEQVEKVNPDLVARDDDGKPYTVRYEAVNAMLLNEFLKEHRKVEELDRKGQKQEAAIGRQQGVIQALIARLNAQESQIRKVSEQVEMSKSAPQVVVNNQ